MRESSQLIRQILKRDCPRVQSGERLDCVPRGWGPTVEWNRLGRVQLLYDRRRRRQALPRPLYHRLIATMAAISEVLNKESVWQTCQRGLGGAIDYGRPRLTGKNHGANRRKGSRCLNSLLAYTTGFETPFHKPYTLKFPQQRYAERKGFRGRHLLHRIGVQVAGLRLDMSREMYHYRPAWRAMVSRVLLRVRRCLFLSFLHDYCPEFALEERRSMILQRYTSGPVWYASPEGGWLQASSEEGDTRLSSASRSERSVASPAGGAKEEMTAQVAAPSQTLKPRRREKAEGSSDKTQDLRNLITEV